MENVNSDISIVKNDQLIIRKYQEEDFEEYGALFFRVFKKAISREFFNWKYKDNPYADLGTSIYLAFNRDGRMVGARAMFPSRITYKGQEYMAAQAGDTMVDEEYRGKGIFKKLTQYAIEDLKGKGYKVIFNFPNSNSYPGYIKLGWMHMEEVNQYFKIINYQRVLKNKFLKIPGVDFCGKALDYFSGSLRKERYKGYSIEEMDTFTKDIIDYIKLSLSDRIHQQRDEAYLNWKYIHKPQGCYKIIIVRKGKDIAAAFIVRLEENNGLKLGNIMDCFATRYEDIKIGIKVLVRFFRKYGADYLSTWYISGVDYKRSLIRNLFFKRKTRIKFVVKPLENGMDFFSDLAIWHVVYGDADTA